jgi:asparaginyl-tRNA synthetase
MATLIKNISSIENIEKEITINGWITSFHMTKRCIFLKISDSWQTKINPIQVVLDMKKYNFDHVKTLSVGASLKITGILVKSPEQHSVKQSYELQATIVHVYGKVFDPATYPFSDNSRTLESIRGLSNLDCHYALKSVIFGIRSKLMEASDIFFGLENFTKVDMPLITFSECEGGCQPMQATLLLSSGLLKDIPLIDSNVDTKVDFSKDFFGTKSSLTVSAQLELETQLPLGPVWTVTRAIRGEPSQTSKHLTEFSMIEMEMPFTESRHDIMDVTERYIKFCVKYVLDHCSKELLYISNKTGKPVIQYSEEPFKRISHEDAVRLMKESEYKFDTDPDYTKDLASEHEKYITDVLFSNIPVFIEKFPKAVKAFYMPLVKEDSPVEHVDCFDLLVPGGVELVGGSQRIHDYDELMERINELKLDIKPLEFYIELRKMGSIPHGGMGMGFERLIKYVTGLDSVKDCVAFPRYIGCGQ